MWVIDHACSVKSAGYWPSSCFACLWTETILGDPGAVCGDGEKSKTGEKKLDEEKFSSTEFFFRPF